MKGGKPGGPDPYGKPGAVPSGDPFNYTQLFTTRMSSDDIFDLECRHCGAEYKSNGPIYSNVCEACGGEVMQKRIRAEIDLEKMKLVMAEDLATKMEKAFIIGEVPEPTGPKTEEEAWDIVRPPSLRTRLKRWLIKKLENSGRR